MTPERAVLTSSTTAPPTPARTTSPVATDGGATVAEVVDALRTADGRRCDPQALLAAHGIGERFIEFWRLRVFGPSASEASTEGYLADEDPNYLMHRAAMDLLRMLQAYEGTPGADPGLPVTDFVRFAASTPASMRGAEPQHVAETARAWAGVAHGWVAALVGLTPPPAFDPAAWPAPEAMSAWAALVAPTDWALLGVDFTPVPA